MLPNGDVRVRVPIFHSKTKGGNNGEEGDQADCRRGRELVSKRAVGSGKGEGGGTAYANARL